jgi:long-chain fatty acid transport protein
MKLKTLSTAMILATIPMTGAFAAAMDRSGQSVSAFLQPGNYFEAGISVLDADVKGQEAGVTTTRRNIGDMAESYYFPNAAIKVQVNDKFSFGLLYDQPFGAKAEYSGNNIFVSNPGSDTVLGASAIDGLITKKAIESLNGLGVNDPTQQQIDGAKQQVSAQLGPVIANANASLGQGQTKVDVHTENLSLIFGYQPIDNVTVYGGPVYQRVKGDVNLRGQAYSLYNGYDAHIKETGEMGWLVGTAYQIPDIALKASITYRSAIKHKAKTTESLALLDNMDPTALQQLLVGGLGLSAEQIASLGKSGKTEIKTPQSVNLDFQTGIMEDTIAFMNVRWVNWSSFSIQPTQFGNVSKAIGALVNKPDGFNLVQYSKDQWSINTGLGRKFTDKWAGNFSIGWDSGAGNPVTTLGPTKGYWSLGLGGQYSPAKDYFVQAGVRYFWLGDAKAQTGAQADTSDYVAKFDKNHALGYALKIGYRF